MFFEDWILCVSSLCLVLVCARAGVLVGLVPSLWSGSTAGCWDVPPHSTSAAPVQLVSAAAAGVGNS